MNDALLHALVDGGNGGAELRGGFFGVAFLDGLAEGAEAGAELGPVGAVYRGSFGGLPGSFERRNMVRHGWIGSLFRKWMRAEETDAAHPPQTLSLRGFAGWVNTVEAATGLVRRPRPR